MCIVSYNIMKWSEVLEQRAIDFGFSQNKCLYFTVKNGLVDFKGCGSNCVEIVAIPVALNRKAVA